MNQKSSTPRTATTFVFLLIYSVGSLFAGTPGEPKLANPSYSTWDSPVINYHLQDDYSASEIHTIYNDASVTWSQISSAQVSAVPLIKDALSKADSANPAWRSWGGTIYIPEGEYLIDDQIIVPEAVCLRGDWDDPSDGDMTVNGTVLHVTHGKGSTADATFLLSDASCISDLSVYYPDQDKIKNNVTTVVLYGPTFKGIGAFCEVRNVTLVNPYQGFDFTRYNGKSVKRPTIRNVYGSPLKLGVRIHETSATPRTLNVKFNPDYWSRSGVDHTPNKNQIKAAIYAADGIAFSIGDGDGGGMLVGIEATGYATGLLNTHASSSRVYDFLIAECEVGIDLKETKSNGWSLTSGQVIDSVERAVRLQDDCRSVRFNDVVFSSDDRLITHRAGLASFINCRFDSWDDNEAINSSANSPNSSFPYILQVEACEFGQNAGSGTDHVKLGSNIVRALMLGNSLDSGGTLNVNDGTGSGAQVLVRNNQSNFTDIPDSGASYTFAARKMPTGTLSIYDVTDAAYGATGNGTTDDTAAIQAALDAACDDLVNGTNANGDIVYLPAGAYRINGHLTVHENMELRGVHASSFDSNSASTILLLYAGKGNAGASPSISLDVDSGIQGICLYRPEQEYKSEEDEDRTPKVLKDLEEENSELLAELLAPPFIETIHVYPPAITGIDSNWAYNLTIANCYDGIDFSVGGGHHLDFVYGSSINDVVKISGDNNNVSVIENLQCKTMAWRKMAGVSLPAFKDNFGDDYIPGQYADQGLGAMGSGANYFGNGTFLTFGCFVNRSHELYRVFGGPDATFINCGGEGESDAKGYIVDSTSTWNGTGNLALTIVSNSFHTGGTYGTFDTQSGDEILLFNSKMYYQSNNFGSPGTLTNYDISGDGSLSIQQDFHPDWADYNVYVSSGDPDILVEGDFYVEGCGEVIRPDPATSGDKFKVRGAAVDPDENGFTEAPHGSPPRVNYVSNFND